jgi:hypothetical protein
MLKVKEPFIWPRGCSCLPRESAQVLIPAGAPVGWNKKNQQHYVKPSFFKDDAIVRHDAVYYGCRVNPNNVVEG